LRNKPRGMPRADDRTVLNGIYWRLRTGSPSWADIAERYGPYTTCYNRFVQWENAGVWTRILYAVSKTYNGAFQMIDSSSIRVHQHAANVRKGGRKPDLGWGPRCRPMHGAFARRTDHEDPRPGRCQWATDRAQTHRGQAHHGRSAADMLTGIGPGQSLLADRAYDSNALRESIENQGGWANIKPMPNRVNIPLFSPFLYKARNLDRALLQQNTALRRHVHPLREDYLAVVKLAFSRIWMRFMSR